MAHNTTERVLLQKSFIAGTYPLTQTTNRLWKLEGGVFFICRRGQASVTIDLKDYTLTPGTEVLLLPGSIFRIKSLDEDFTIPNDKYFDHIEALVDLADSLGLQIGLLPTWGDKF